MKSVINRGAQAFLTAAALGLTAALFIPWAEPVPARTPLIPSTVAEANPSSDPGKPERVAPQTIVALFVGRRSSAPATQGTPSKVPIVPEIKKPIDAPWLSYLGYYRGAPGRPYYLLKDIRSGRVIQVPPTVSPASGLSLRLLRSA